MRRTVSLLMAAAFMALLVAAPGAQQSPADTWLNAVDEWNSGRYPDALRDLTALMKTPAASEYHDRIALLTGELYTTTEITTDGRNPRISSTGEYVAYDTGPAGAAATTRVVAFGRPCVKSRSCRRRRRCSIPPAGESRGCAPDSPAPRA